MGTDLDGQESPNSYGIFHDLLGWRDRHNLDHYQHELPKVLRDRFCDQSFSVFFFYLGVKL